MAKLILDIAKEIVCNREGEYLSEKYVNTKNIAQERGEVQGKQHEQHVKHFHKDPVKFDACSDQKERMGFALRYVWYYEDPYVVIPNHLRELGLVG
ncbi:hypothetical protein RhiirA5_425932 [Rhizophagus irregularis]|uniref:Uncharacterized protein n=1 Tax=Rhizophagus irregularis TaxID=588596 RepID=A0A2N0P539_9GLOM|nr:hypothetical protein RhiirA5_425932 [Rhizophagus irregularis]